MTQSGAAEVDAGAPAASLDLPVLGMTCAACVRRVEKAIGKVEGVRGVDVNLALSRARVEGTAAAAAVVAAVHAAGYEVPADALVPDRRVEAVERARAEEVGGLRRDAAIAFALAIPLVVLGMADVATLAQAALGTAIVVGPGRRYWLAGARAVVHGSPDMNTLIALGVGAAWGASIVALARGTGGPTYFEAAGAIVAFVLLGKVLEARVRAKLVGVARGLVELSPQHAHRADGTRVLAAELAAGDVILVKPGERLAADGTVVGGTGTVDESMLTGESMPVDKREGSPAYAGTLAQLGMLEVRVARAGQTTALARIARAVEDAQSNKAAIARLADRVSAVFVPIVLALAAATFLAWWLAAGSSADTALARAIAVLVIACPCALGLATPAAIAVGTARAAELGVLFRGGTALEAASAITVIALDKTGTLTTGVPALVDLGPRTSDLGQNEVLAFAAAAELASEHPIARAIVDGAKARGLAIVKPSSVEVAPGGGITAVVDGRTVKIGSAEFVGATAIDSPYTVCHVAIDGVVVGWLAVADAPRPEAAATIATLRALGYTVVMITGDREGPARAIAREVGIEAIHANVKPTEKAALVQTLQFGRGPTTRVAFIGDGINDAPALAAADLGIALASGTDLASAAADITIFRGGLATVPVALALARATLHTIRRNLVAAFVYNAICIPIAAAGLLSPMFAAAAMSLSSVSVLISSLRLRRVRPPGS